MTAREAIAGVHSPAGFAAAVAARVARGGRFCGVFASPAGDGTRLIAVVADGGALCIDETVLAPEERHFASLTPSIPAAAWYEREIHDLFGLEPVGHPRLDPLVFPGASDVAPLRERPTVPAVPAVSAPPASPVELDLSPLPGHVHGEGVFTISYGPVRSGVFETVEYLIETSGEDIPHLRTRVFYKHRGIEARVSGMQVDDGVLAAERVEGVASVAHAIAYCSAVEQMGGVVAPRHADLVRVVHAELERVANHLDTVVRHTEASGQAVAYACFSHHKERVQRLRASLCGSRFGRGVVVPGGVSGPPRLGASELLDALGSLHRAIGDDLHRLMGTPSFVDRLRGTGVLSCDTARRYAAVGPVGRASGQPEDVRTSRPYAAYGRLGQPVPERHDAGDALARQHVRLEEIAGAFHLVRQAVDLLDELGEPDRWSVAVPAVSGRALGWAEAPQGELLSLVEADGGALVRVKHRSASFHNLAAYPAAFPQDIFTDVAFIEASFGLSIAGAAG